jgi:hypothetical protein
MSKFVLVKELPETLNKGEVAITEPNFMPEILQNMRKAPRVKNTAINHLREILNSIAVKYDQSMDVMRIRLHNYEGVPYSDDADLHKIIIKILSSEYPVVLEKYLDYQIKSRPMGTKLVYFSGALSACTPFYNNGLDLIEEKDVDSYLSGKPKKVVGKPAITKEQAELTKEVNN